MVRWMLNDYRVSAGDMSKIYKICENVKIVEFHDHIIWNHHKKCIWISTNMPSIGLVIHEIAIKISEMR